MTAVAYKLVDRAEWDSAIAAGAYAGSAVDRADGYIHMSTAAQVAETARRHFAGQDGLWLVEVALAPLGEAVKWEASRGGDLFPHLFAPCPPTPTRPARPVGRCGRRHALRGRDRRMAVTDVGAALLRALDPETAHTLALRALRMAPLPPARADDPVLATTVAGLSLPNPVGLAAGLDKNGEALHGLSRLGFGFLECGSVTPQPQPGNPKPRLFRLSEDRAIINRMGFNNAGLETFAGRLADRPRGAVVGANLGANKDTEDKAADYVEGLIRLKGLADYVTVNVSSPNTPGLRALQGRAALDDLLGRLAEARGEDLTPSS